MDNTIYIFDSLSHPCFNYKNFDSRLVTSFKSLQKSMLGTQVKWAVAVGYGHIIGSQHEKFIAYVNKYNNLIPIAGIDPLKINNVLEELNLLNKLGFKGIKLHPRFSNFSLNDDLSLIYNIVEKLELVVYYCTYHWGSPSSHNQFSKLNSIISNHPKLKMVLVHGGCIELMKYAELVRAFPNNFLLDLSLTLLKYEGSSIDLDLKFLFSKFDKRICIGSDFPQYNHKELCRRFNELSDGLEIDKKKNIAYKNLMKFLSLEETFLNKP